MSTVVHTSEKEVRDFFSFCGKISSISVTPEGSGAESPKSATVTFEKETAAKTALLLDNTQLGPSQVHVSPAAGLDQLSGSTGATAAGESPQNEHDIDQDDKPRSRVVAEYLAHGYVLSDKAIQGAIALDQKHGISNRFTSALQTFDQRTKATDRARDIDANYGLSKRAGAGWAGLNSYFEKALETPTGQKLAAFYEKGDKEVRDIHAEARRLADIKAGKSSSTEGTEGAAHIDPNAEVHNVAGTDKTTCTCAGNEGKCGCQPGHCACSSCPRSSDNTTTTTTTTGSATEKPGQTILSNSGAGATSATSATAKTG